MNDDTPSLEVIPLLRLVIYGAYVLAFVSIGAGVILAYLGETGDTEFDIFGQTFKSTNVGIAAMGLGVISTLLIIYWTIQKIKAGQGEGGSAKKMIPVENVVYEHITKILDRKKWTWEKLLWYAIDNLKTKKQTGKPRRSAPRNPKKVGSSSRQPSSRFRGADK